MAGQNPVFANDMRQNGIYTQMVPNDLAHQPASNDMHIDLLRSFIHTALTSARPDQTWDHILKLTAQGQKCMLRTGSVTKLDGDIFIFVSLISQMLSAKNNLCEKR